MQIELPLKILSGGAALAAILKILKADKKFIIGACVVAIISAIGAAFLPSDAKQSGSGLSQSGTNSQQTITTGSNAQAATVGGSNNSVIQNSPGAMVPQLNIQTNSGNVNLQVNPINSPVAQTIVVNDEPTRVIDTKDANKFIVRLMNAPKGDVSIHIDGNSNEETKEYAVQIKEMITAAGYNVAPLFSEFGSGRWPKGVWLGVKHTNAPPKFGPALQKALKEIGIIAPGAQSNEADDTSLVIYVGAASQPIAK